MRRDKPLAVVFARTTADRPSAARRAATSRWPRKKIASTLARLGPPLAGSPVGHQRALRDDVRVGADVGVVGAGLVAEPLDDRERVRDRVVLGDAVAGVGPDEQRLARLRPARAAASLPRPAPPCPAAGAPGGPVGAWANTHRLHSITAIEIEARRYRFIVLLTVQGSRSGFKVRGSGFACRSHCSEKAMSVSAVGLWRKPPPPAAITTYCLPSRPM